MHAVAICLIAAMSENRVIGKAGALPWHLPEDLARFRALTSGHHVIMGRKTWETLDGPLPGRVNIVITRRRAEAIDGALVAGSLEEALELAAGDDDVFILGGGEIYQLALDRADRIYLTVVHAHLDGDAFFPELDPARWRLVEDERHEADDRHTHAYSFRVYAQQA